MSAFRAVASFGLFLALPMALAVPTAASAQATDRNLNLRP